MITFLQNFSNRFTRLREIEEILTLSKVFWSIILICLLMISFALGRLSKIFEEKPVFSLTEMSQNDNNDKDSKFSNSTLDINDLQKYKNTSTSTIVASKKGKKYYFIWCKYASTIKESNRIYFKNEDEAKASGRDLASACK